MKKYAFIIIGVTFLLFTAAATLYVFYHERPGNSLSNPSVSTTTPSATLPILLSPTPSVITSPLFHPACLEDNEVATYTVSENPNGGGIATIFIKNKETGEEIFNFQFEILIPDYHSVELHKCGAYAVRDFNYDFNTRKSLPRYRAELWEYDYSRNGKMIVLLDEDTLGNLKGYKHFFSSDFRVNPNEKYVSLIRGYLGQPDYALIIKNLENTSTDVFILSITGIEKRNPDLVNDIELDGWTKDNRYFWARTHYGANVLGFIRIDIKNKTFDLFPAPNDVLGGDALNIEKGLITVHPDNVWYGIADVVEQEKTKRRNQGIGTELYLENLFNHARQLVASTTEPLYYFKPQWLSDTELQYELPIGEKKIYKINE